MKSLLWSNLAIAFLVLTPVLVEAVFPAIAVSQSSSRYNNSELVKARNLARQTIEARNGGLNRYRAENSMHGPVRQAPFTENEDGSLTFKFFGGAPGSKAYTVESVVTINPADWSIRVDYNGKTRS